MAELLPLTIYTLEHCPNCEILKDFLKKNGITYDEKDMSSAESLTELRINGIFVNEAPVLQKDSSFLTSADLFSKGQVRGDTVRKLIEGA
jgi:glutaredoxin